MSNAKIIQITNARTLLQGQLHSLSALTLKKLKSLHLCTALLALRKTVNLLTYKSGDNPLVQDIKVLLIHSLAFEAASVNHPELYKRFIRLLGHFPHPPLLEGYLFQDTLRPHLGSGLIGDFYKLAKPKLGDGPAVLRAKQAAHLRNYAKDLAIILGIDLDPRHVCTVFEAQDYPFFFKEARDIFEAHLRHMPPDLAALVRAHVLEPDTPFNVALK